MAEQQRVDKLLVDSGELESRTLAQRALEAGLVEYFAAGRWQKVERSAQKFPTDTEFRVLPGPVTRYVSRAGLKLETALAHFQIDVRGLRALDLGQSTGGFSDCLLQGGCASVCGVDVGHGQLHASLRHNKNLCSLEGVNARNLGLDDFPAEFAPPFDLVVMDLSFISQTLVLPRLAALMKGGASLVSLVKPQFEVGPEGLTKGGLVKDSSLIEGVKSKIEDALASSGLCCQGFVESILRGGDGNRELLVLAHK